MVRFWGVILLTILWSCTKSGETPPINGDNIKEEDPYESPWQLVYEENFDDGNVNLGKDWYVYHSAGHNSNGLRRASAINVANGLLTITAQMLDQTLVSGGDGT